MQWINPKLGDERIITKFLCFPKNINNTTKWLEKVSIRQRYVRFCNKFYTNGWDDIKWERDIDEMEST